jgi:hypothetical protein
VLCCGRESETIILLQQVQNFAVRLLGLCQNIVFFEKDLKVVSNHLTGDSFVVPCIESRGLALEPPEVEAQRSPRKSSAAAKFRVAGAARGR